MKGERRRGGKRLIPYADKIRLMTSSDFPHPSRVGGRLFPPIVPQLIKHGLEPVLSSVHGATVLI